MILLQIGVLFGQMRQQQPPPGPNGTELAGIFCIYGVLLAIGLIIQIFFLLTLSRCLHSAPSGTGPWNPAWSG